MSLAGGVADADDVALLAPASTTTAAAPASASAAPGTGRRVLIVTTGSRGDVQPFVAIGTALRARGDAVCIVTHERFRVAIEPAGLEWLPLPGDPQAVLSSERFRHAYYEGSTREQIKVMLEGYDQDAGNAALWAAVQRWQPTLLVCSLVLMYSAWAISERARVPFVSVSPAPYLLSDEYPVIGLGGEAVRPACINRLLHRVVGALQRRVFATATDKLRTELLGLPRARRMDADIIPMAVIASPLVIPNAARWPHTCVSVGYQIVPLPGDYTPPADLRAFLDAGTPPLYVGFGSMPLRDTRAMAQLVVDGCRELGVRVVVCAGWGSLVGGADAGGTGDHGDGGVRSVFSVADVPHEYLLPRCCGAVHHGGAGTTAASMVCARACACAGAPASSPPLTPRVRVCVARRRADDRLPTARRPAVLGGARGRAGRRPA